MLPISAKDLVRFTPPGCEEQENPPVYLIAVPTVKTAPLFECELTAAGLTRVSEQEVREAVEQAVHEVAAPHLQADLLAVVERYWQEAARVAAANAARRQRSAEDQVPAEEIDLETARLYHDLVTELRELSPPLARLLARRQRFLSLFPVIACQCFLKGVENVSVEFKLAGGMVSEATLSALNSDHVQDVGFRALSLLSLSDEQRKNLSSPSPSPSNPRPSTEKLPKAATGKSTAKSTPTTPAAA